MADVTIRNPRTLEEREVPQEAAERGFFPGWVVLDKAGRVKAHQPETAPTENKED